MNGLELLHDLRLDRLQRVSFVAGVLAIGICLLGVFINARQFFQSYLFGFIYWWIVSMGCLGLSVIYQMTGGKWGYAARPFLDSGIRTLPLVSLGFVPLALGLEHIYPWAQPDYFAADPHAHYRQWYLQPPFFIGRAIAYLAICLALGWLLTIGVARNDQRMPRRIRPPIGGLGAVVLVLVVTFAAVDWTMTLEPHYHSTIYGALFCGGALLCGTCLATACVALSIQRTGRRDEESITIVHDLGKLLLAMLMVWAYLSFSQFLITYSGNLPHAAAWYVHRLSGGWQWLPAALVVLHFGVPFGLLLSRPLKRDPGKLAAVAIGLAVIHMIEVFWTIAPSFHKSSFRLHWLDLAALVAIGGIWFAEFFRQLKHRLVSMLPHWPHPDRS